MEAGGWAVLNMWLVEAKKSHNFPLMVEILQVCVCVSMYDTCSSRVLKKSMGGEEQDPLPLFSPGSSEATCYRSCIKARFNGKTHQTAVQDRAPWYVK